MKLHVAALCVAGTMAASAAWGSGAPTRRMDRTSMQRERSSYRVGMTDRDPSYLMTSGYQDPRVTASKIGEIVTAHRLEVQDLRTMGDRAVQAGWTNIHSVYMDIAPDHERAAAMGETWFRNNGFTHRMEMRGGAQQAANISPEGSVDAQIMHHEHMFNESLGKLRGEQSPAVRGMLLMTAAGANRHRSLLRWLDEDVNRGEKTVTAAVQGGMMSGQVAGARQSTDMNMNRNNANPGGAGSGTGTGGGNNNRK